jgi:hypothetical protein
MELLLDSRVTGFSSGGLISLKRGTGPRDGRVNTGVKGTVLDDARLVLVATGRVLVAEAIVSGLPIVSPHFQGVGAT